MAQRNHRLIDGKIAKYMLPSIMMNMAMQLGNIVDTMLVGNLLGTKAMSAIMLCMPVALLEHYVCIRLYKVGKSKAPKQSVSDDDEDDETEIEDPNDDEKSETDDTDE